MDGQALRLELAHADLPTAGVILSDEGRSGTVRLVEAI